MARKESPKANAIGRECPIKKEFDARFENSPKSEGSLEDFSIIKTIGAGGFGRVYLVKHKKTEKFYAMKTLEKKKVIRYRQIEHSKNEKKILQAIKFPFVVSMEYFFQDHGYLYFVMPFIAGGDMFNLLRSVGKFTEEQAIFFASQVVLALEYLHMCLLVYRDLKPENIMIDEKGYIKLTDFGFCKRLEKERTWTTCGTPHYLAPEIIMQKGYEMSGDWWALGILIFEMTAGFPPFDASYHMVIYEKILECKIVFPPEFGKDLINIITNIIQVDVSKRLGCMKGGTDDLKKHPWFKNLNWKDILEKKVKAPYIPPIKSPDDTQNFDKYEEITMVVTTDASYDPIFKDF